MSNAETISNLVLSLNISITLICLTKLYHFGLHIVYHNNLEELKMLTNINSFKKYLLSIG